jgi:NAD(P)-dependent dehydrogenase (short-subunit alcohol dehydrogenase family)
MEREMNIRFDGQVAIVTGAGNGLGRCHALALAARGAKVVVNDLGGARDGTGASSAAAQAVVDEILSAGGEAMANGASVTDFAQVEAMVAQAKAKWGRVDILINNAGVLRDKTFSKVSIDDFKFVLDVHLMGTVNCTKAVWDLMREQQYGRIVVTSSSSGLYGNFGQTNYGAAKLGVVGLMNTLKLEGAKYNVRTNAVAPTAATRMTEELFPDDMLAQMGPEQVTPGVLFLCSVGAPNGEILCAGAGCFARARIIETQGVYLGADATPEMIAQQWDTGISDDSAQKALRSGMEQPAKFGQMVAAAHKA